MFEDKETIYTKRYPQTTEDMEVHLTITPTQREKSFQDFCRRMSGKTHYEPIPGKNEVAKKFVVLATAFSEENEIDIDIKKSPHSVEVYLHFYCMAFSKFMTRQFAQIVNMCDNLTSFILKTEPSDFTLVLEVHTHKYYISDKLINDF